MCRPEPEVRHLTDSRDSLLPSASAATAYGAGMAHEEPAGERPLPADERPPDDTPVHTADLPATPTRDRNIVAAAWIEAPPELLKLANDLPAPDGPLVIVYKRRIGPWLLWRAGPARGADARYLAIRSDDLAVHSAFRLFPDGSGDGIGPSGTRHARFRAWKEDLLGRGDAHETAD